MRTTRPHALAVQCPLNFCTFPALSLAGNRLEDEGCKAVAAVLPETQIKELKCAPPAQALLSPLSAPCLPFMSAPAEHFDLSCTPCCLWQCCGKLSWP